MKKNNIFNHELNESIQANAAMNCLNNRNKHKQINEVAPVVAAAGRMLLPMLRPVITKLVQKALVNIGTHARPTEVLKLVMSMLTKGELAKKMAEKCGQTWNEIPSDVKKEIRDAIIDAFKSQSPQEQEELPSMERRDIILALSEYMSESWIDTGDDGDLDDIYYAVADILDKTGDYPASTDWKDCKPWCQKHYQEVEARIYNEEEEASCTSKVTVRTPMGMKQMNLSTEVIEAFVQQTGSHDFSDRSAVRVIAGIVKEMAKKGYTPTEDEQKIVDIQNKKIKQGMASRNAATDRSMNALSD